jgi:hypothetical protein
MKPFTAGVCLLVRSTECKAYDFGLRKYPSVLLTKRQTPAGEPLDATPGRADSLWMVTVLHVL